jgi:DNA-binding response OmpR family regulator
MDASIAAPQPGVEARTVTVGHLSVELSTGAILLGGQCLPLPPHHRKLLLRLAREEGRFVPGAELRDCAGIQADRENKNLRNQVWRLRKRLAQAGCRLEGAAGLGYRLIPVSSPATSAANTS